MARPISNRQCKEAYCNRKHFAYGWCEAHAAQVRRGGTPMPIKDGPGQRKKAVCGYRAAHARVNREKGAARNYTCVDCGNGAWEWSLSHDASEVFVSEALNSYGKEYSLNVDEYFARCKKCHYWYDKNGGKK